MVSVTPDIDFMVGVLHALLDDLSLSNGINNTVMDKRTITARTQFEGVGFLTKTLPKLGSAVDTALRTGKLVVPTNFGTHRSTALPKFLKGLLRRIFDDNGYLVLEPDWAAITEVRQVCYFCYKTEIPFNDEQQLAASNKFKQNDSDLPSQEDLLVDDNRSILYIAKGLIEDLFSQFDPYDIVPSHGPGIVASGEKPHEKRTFRVKYKAIHDEYPYYRWFHINHLDLLDRADVYRRRIDKEVGINKVLFVPKDSRGPRTIACEPLEYMFIQQGLRKSLYDWIERHPLTKGRVNFTDQSINKRLAHYASLHPDELVTLDLKDASDRVSNDLVKYLFSGTRLGRCLQALRTPHSSMPDGTVVHLRKYAAMGSALCFPIEAVVFYVLALASCTFFEKPVKPIYVYGDDIICSPDDVEPIMKTYGLCGIKVNTDKSCLTGFFRESCGGEFYKGFDVGYVKLRKASSSSPASIASLVETSNLLWEKAYYRTAKYIEAYVSKTRYIPFGNCNSEYLCYNSPRHTYVYQGRWIWNRRFQYKCRKVPVVSGNQYYASFDTDTEKYEEYFRKLTQGWSDFFEAGFYAERRLKINQKLVEVTR